MGSKNGLPPLKKGEWPIFYLSGRFGVTGKQEADWIKRTGCNKRCWSFAFIKPGAFYYRPEMGSAYQASCDLKCHIAMDSSAFSFQQFTRKGRVENIEKYRAKTIDQYIEFVHAESKKWDFYFNFDYRIHAPTVYKMQKFLEKHGLRPAPVFHGDDGLDWLRKYIDEGHKVIGIGAAPHIRRTWEMKRFYLDQVFELTEKAGVLCHGLAFTSMSLAFSYPWYSVDSSTWSRFAAFGQVVFVNPINQTLDHLHISERHSEKVSSYNRMPKDVQKEIRKQIESPGFDFKTLRNDLNERAVYNGWVYSHLPELGIKKGVGKTKWMRLL